MLNQTACETYGLLLLLSHKDHFAWSLPLTLCACQRDGIRCTMGNESPLPLSPEAGVFASCGFCSYISPSFCIPNKIVLYILLSHGFLFCIWSSKLTPDVQTLCLGPGLVSHVLYMPVPVFARISGNAAIRELLCLVF